MDALILTCGTGGGHNAAAKAIEEELINRGDRVVVLNPYNLCSVNMAGVIDRTYIRLVQQFPEGFGFIYLLGEMYRRLPFRSPVYFLNRKAAAYLRKYLNDRKFDIIITTHLFPGEIMTLLKNSGADIPPVIYVATDYTCIPFTEDTDCDAYVIPVKELIEEFVRRGIPADRIYPLGIPIRESFRKPFTYPEAKAVLGLEKETDYLLLAGGSIGAGKLTHIVKKLRMRCTGNERLIVICGSNEKLFKKLQKQYDDIMLLQSTEQMAEYIRASKMYFTKPGGLSSTEAAIMGTVLVHLPPIPGCETKNARFFKQHGMSCYFKSSKKGIAHVHALANDMQAQNRMISNQKKFIHMDASEEICNLAQSMASSMDHIRKE